MSTTPTPSTGAATSTAAAPKTTRITKEAATALLQHFTLVKWPLNKSLPRSDLHGDVAAIAKKYGFTKKQVARQLKSYEEAENHRQYFRERRSGTADATRKARGGSNETDKCNNQPVREHTQKYTHPGRAGGAGGVGGE